MPSEPQVKPLSLFRRQILFGSLVAFFVIALPIFIFYATGYRYDIMAEVPTITATGGIYITSTLPDANIYVNEVVVTNARTFRNASYLQGLTAGVHRIHVQSDGADTWVKELMVLPHIVTEAESFNMPLIPHIRPITRYTTTEGLPVVMLASTSTEPFLGATTTSPFLATTSKAIAALTLNREYMRIASLFTEKASTTALRTRLEAEVVSLTSRNGKSATTSTSTLAKLQAATTTVVSDDIALYRAGEEVFAKTLGTGRRIPGYFCAVKHPTLDIVTGTNKTASSTLGEISQTVDFVPGNLGRLCRSAIRIDRKWQSVIDFMFMPGDTNLVLMHLTNGLYVVEIDDRSWQNVQLLYPGQDLAVLTDGDSIYASSTAGIIEIYTEVPRN